MYTYFASGEFWRNILYILIACTILTPVVQVIWVLTGTPFKYLCHPKASGHGPVKRTMLVPLAFIWVALVWPFSFIFVGGLTLTAARSHADKFCHEHLYALERNQNTLAILNKEYPLLKDLYDKVEAEQLYIKNAQENLAQKAAKLSNDEAKQTLLDEVHGLDTLKGKCDTIRQRIESEAAEVYIVRYIQGNNEEAVNDVLRNKLMDTYHELNALFLKAKEEYRNKHETRS